MALAQVLISWHESLETPVTDSMVLYLNLVLQPFKLSAITVDDTKAGKLNGIAEKLSQSMSVAKEKLRQDFTALTLLIGNVDRSYMHFCDWKEFESLAQARQGDPSTFMITRWEGNIHTYGVEQYKEFCSTHQLQPFKKRIVRKRQNSAKPGVLQSFAIEPRDPDLPTPDGLTDPPFPSDKPEEIKVDPVSVYPHSQLSSDSQLSVAQNSPQLSYVSHAPPSNQGLQNPTRFSESSPALVQNPLPRNTGAFQNSEERKDPAVPSFRNPAPIQRQNPEIQRPSTSDIQRRQSDKQGHIKRSIEEASASIRRRLEETMMRFVPSPNLQQGQLGQAMSRQFAYLLHNKEQTLSAQVQQYTGSLCTDVSSVVDQVLASEGQCKASVLQYHNQAYEMYQDIGAMQQGLLAEMQGEKSQAVQKMSADLEQVLANLEQRVNVMTPPKIVPMKVTLGASQAEGAYCYFLIVRWKTRLPEEAKNVKIVSTAGVIHPKEVVLSKDVELIPFDAMLPTEIDLRERGVSLLKQPLRLTQADIDANQQAPEWKFNCEAFHLEQQVAIQYMMTHHQQITSKVIENIQELMASTPDQSPGYYLAQLR